MLKQKTERAWLALVVLAVIFLTVGCDLNQASYQNTRKLLMFDYNYDVSSNWERRTSPATVGIRVDGAVRIAESSPSNSYSTYSPTGKMTIQSKYRFKDGNLLANELVELKNLITAAERTKWKDEECNALSTSLKHIQIDFYNVNKKVNNVDICFLRGDNQTAQYLPPDLPENVRQLVDKLIDIKEGFDDLPWFEQEIQYSQVFDLDWWSNKGILLNN